MNKIVMQQAEQRFQVAQFQPKGDQISAIEQLVRGLKESEKH